MGLLLDIVPNHMAAIPENPWWQDFVHKGHKSPYAIFFDMDWLAFGETRSGTAGYRRFFDIDDLVGIRVEDRKVFEATHSLILSLIAEGKIIYYGIKYKLGFPYMTCAIRKTKIHTDAEIKGCSGGYDWEWIYSKADSLTFFEDSLTVGFSAFFCK